MANFSCTYLKNNGGSSSLGSLPIPFFSRRPPPPHPPFPFPFALATQVRVQIIIPPNKSVGVSPRSPERSRIRGRLLDLWCGGGGCGGGFGGIGSWKILKKNLTVF